MRKPKIPIGQRAIEELDGPLQAHLGPTERGRRTREEVAFLRWYGIPDEDIARRFKIEYVSFLRRYGDTSCPDPYPLSETG